MSYDEKIWEQHPEESSEAYRCFLTYYCDERTPSARNVMKAYRKYLVKELGKTDDEADKATSAGKFGQWSRGEDNTGLKISGLDTWESRAIAYWDWLGEDELNLITDRRAAIIENEIVHGKSMLSAWEDMMFGLLKVFASERDELKKAKLPYDASSHIRKLKDLMAVREDIAVFLRRAVGMPETVKEDIYAKALKHEKVEIQWYEPDIKYEPDDMDVTLGNLTNEEFEQVLERLGDK